METKFIGLEGFNEIESLSTTKQITTKKQAHRTKVVRNANSFKSKKLNKFQKTIRFTRRLSKEISKSIRAIYAAKKAKALSKKALKNPKLSLIDRCYIENRNGKPNEYSASARDAITNIKMIDGRKYAHIAPVNSSYARTGKRKAALATIACLMAITVPCMTGTSTINTYALTNKTGIDKLPETNLSYTSTADEAPENLNDNVNEAIAAELKNMNGSTVGLYVDGEFYGATTDKTALNNALEDVLKDYRDGYDDETTTEFVNDITLVNGNYKLTEILSVEEIIANAKDEFSISLSTDMVYEIKISHDTKYEEDNTKSSSYSKTKTKGKDGKAEVTMRTTFVDGVQVDAVETKREVIKKAVDEVIVKGTIEDSYNSYSSDASSYSIGSFMWPVPYTSRVSSYYGWRWGRLHEGIDIADSGVYGKAIVASDGGVVTFAGDKGDGYGYYAIVDHGNGYETVYAHCSSLAVSNGQYVSQGDVIGYVGSTGYSTGPHLHFEIRENGVKLNPMNFF